MFGISKNDLVKNLKSINRQICRYSSLCENEPSFHCDCKYGAESVHNLICESGGCPELRLATALISQLDQTEYLSLCADAGILVNAMNDKKA